MFVYSVVLFLHIVGALALFAGVGLEQAALANVRRASTVAQLREWVRLLGANRFVEGPGAFTILATGIYMAMTRWGHHAWIALGLLGLVLMGILGAAVSRRRVDAIRKELPAADGPVSGALRRRLHDPMLRASATIRAAIGVGVVFIMTVKPGTAGASTALGVALALGVVVAMAGWGEGRRGSAAGERATQS